MDSSTIAKNLLIFGLGGAAMYFYQDYKQKQLVPNPEDLAAAEIEAELERLGGERYQLERGPLDRDLLSEYGDRDLRYRL